MNVKKQIKNYYRSRVEVQKVPPLDERLQKRIEPAGSEKRKRTLVFDLVFHAGIHHFHAARYTICHMPRLHDI